MPQRRPQAPQPARDGANEIIDLTGEDSPSRPSGPTYTNLDDSPPVRLGDAARGPRFANNIIDLVADSPVHSPRQQPSVPDVEFLHSRTLPPPRRHNHSNLHASANPMEPRIVPPATRAFLENRADPFGFEHLRQLAVGSMDHILRHSALSEGFSLRAIRLAQEARRPAIMVFNRASARPGPADVESSTGSSSFGSDMLDTEMSGPEEGSAADTSYQAPPTPPLGFTRTPAAADVLICPNCDEELCVGDDEVARQVWAIKACGHVSTLTFVLPR
jgi:hypothetical protein